MRPASVISVAIPEYTAAFALKEIFNIDFGKYYVLFQFLVAVHNIFQTVIAASYAVRLAFEEFTFLVDNACKKHFGYSIDHARAANAKRTSAADDPDGRFERLRGLSQQILSLRAWLSCRI